MASGYERAITNDVTPMQGRPVSVAAALGGGIEQVGQALGQAGAVLERANEGVADSQFRVAKLQKDRADAAATAVGIGQLADMQIALGDTLATLPQRDQPGAVGYGQAAGQTVEKAVSDFLTKLPNDDVRQHFAPTVQRLRESLIGGAHDYERGAFVQLQGDSAGKWLTTTANSLMLNPSTKGFEKALADWQDFRTGLKLGAEVGDKLDTKGKSQLTGALFDGMLRAGAYGQVRKAVESGQFNFLDPRLVGHYLDAADQGEKVQAREADLAAKQAQEGVRTDIAAIKVQIDNHQDVPISQINAVLGRAKATGLPADEMLKAGFLFRDMAQDRQLRGLGSAAIENAIGEVQAKAAAGKASSDDMAFLDRAQLTLKTRGGEQAKVIGPLLRGGTQQWAAGVQQLSTLSRSEAMRVGEAAGDTSAAIVAGLRPQARDAAVIGRAQRMEDPVRFLPPEDPVHKGEKQRWKSANDQFDAAIGPDVRLRIGPHYNAVRDAALNIMAAHRSDFDSQDFRKAVRVVMGGSARADGTEQGGLGQWNGRPFELPDKWNNAEFGRYMGRIDYSAAAYANGRAPHIADITRHFHPSYVDTDPAGRALYRLIGPDKRPLMRKDGKGEFMIAMPAQP